MSEPEKAGPAPSAFWTAWSRVITRYPWPVTLTALATCAAFALLYALTPKDLSFTGLLDENEPEIRRYKEAVREFGSQSTLVVLLEGPREELDRVTERMTRELPERAPVRAIYPPADPAWLTDRAPWLWPDALFNSVAAEAGRPPDRPVNKLAANSVRTADELIRKRLRPLDEAVLISMEFNSDIFDMAMGGEDFHAVERETSAILAESGGRVTAGFTGMAAIAAQDQNSVLTRVRILTPLTFLLVLLLLRGVETRFLRLALAGLALGGSVVISFGMVGLIVGRLTITATFFGMLLLGLGIDFSIHLLVAMRDARARGDSPEEAVSHALERTGTAIVLGGLTTALATGVVMLIPEPGSRDMGMTATFGLIASLILMLTLLPAGWLILERRHSLKADPPARFTLPGLHAIVDFSVRRPVPVLVVTLAFCLLGAEGLRHYHMETDLEKIFTRDVQGLVVERRINELFDVSPTSYLAPVESVAQAREWGERMRELPDIAEVASVADILPVDGEARAARIREALAEAEAHAAGRTGGDVPPERAELIARLRRAIDLGPIDPAAVPASLRNGIIGRTGALALRIVPRDALLDAKKIRERILAYRDIAPTLTGIPVVSELLMSGRRDWIPILMGIIFTAVLTVLVFSFRKPLDIALAMLPVLIATLVTMGLYCRLGERFDFSFSILTAIVVPVILGLGVDDGIHVVERLRRYETLSDDEIREAVEGVGRAIFLTSATTTASFIGLFFSNHYGLESIARFMAIGVPMCFICSVTVLPAAVRVTRRFRR